MPSPQRAARALGERGHVRVGRVEVRDDRVGVPQEQLAGGGQGDAARAAGPVDEPLADDALELRDLLADRRLRVAELAGGGAERAVAGDRLERGEMAQLDSQPRITFHNRNERLLDWV